MILHLMLNSLLVFFFLACCVELSLFIFRIKNPRVRYFCRTLPLLKIPFDLFLFTFYGDSLFFNLNPFSCEFMVHDWIKGYWPSTVCAKPHLFIPYYLTSRLSTLQLNIFTITTLLIALGAIVYKGYLLIQARKQLNAILNKAVPYPTHSMPTALQTALNASNAKILSSAIEIPCATYPNLILLPEKSLQALTKEELHAVIAHELQHLKWKDPLCNIFYGLISSLCWWIPTRWWLKKVIAEQEQSADQNIYPYGIQAISLASAISKILKHSKRKEKNTLSLCYLGSCKGAHLDRIRHILNTELLPTKSYFLSFLMLTFSLVVFLSVWMC